MTIETGVNEAELGTLSWGPLRAPCAAGNVSPMYTEGTNFEAPAPDHAESGGAGLGEENLGASWSL